MYCIYHHAKARGKTIKPPRQQHKTMHALARDAVLSQVVIYALAVWLPVVVIFGGGPRAVVAAPSR